MKLRLLLQLLLCTACTGIVAVRESHKKDMPRPPHIDYRYHDKDGRQKWCVYCMDNDWQKNMGERGCYTKPNVKQLIEQQEWNNQTRNFWPVCGYLQTDRHYFRYIKNCTAPPIIEGATVNCTDQDGRQLYRVHDTCRVTCTKPRTRPSDNITTCDPWTATWTSVTCEPDACPPLRSVIGKESKTSCDLDIDQPLNKKCDVRCMTPVGHDSTTRVMQCRDGRWQTVEPCPALSACPQLSNIINDDESTTCNVSKWLPGNTTCEITCPEGYTPTSRAMVCSDSKWKALMTCAPQPGGGMLMVIVCVFGALVLLFIVLILVFLLRRRFRQQKDNSNKNQDFDAAAQALPLITTPSGSTTTGSEYQVSIAKPSDVDETSFTTDDTISTGSNVEGEGLRADDLLPPYSSRDVMEHDITVVEQASFNKGDFAAPEVCNNVQIFYKRNDEDPPYLLPVSCEIQTSARSRLMLYAVCGHHHQIVQFFFGPSFIGDKHESFETGVRLNVTWNTQDNYLLCAKCSHGGEVVIRVFIRVTDNPDETYIKEIFEGGDEFDSLNSTETEHNMSGGGAPSKSLEAEPISLPSNPSLGKYLHTDSDGEEDYIEAGGRTGARDGSVALERGKPKYGMDGALDRTSAIDDRLGPAVSSLSLASRCTQGDDENDPVRECTLLLMDLQKRGYKKLLDTLVLKLEPLNTREADRTIFGATLSILGFSEDRVEHVVWARRENLRNTPARTLLSLMMQAGKRGGHLVRYFADKDHCNKAIVTILKRAHHDCQFCQHF